MIWFTSDQHFYHKKMLEYRNFNTIEEMNNFLIKKYNQVVKDKDIVYFLGDFSFGTVTQTIEILKQLKGHKHLILGNHDRKKIYKKNIFKQYFESITDYYELKYNHQLYILCHYPFETWHKKNYGSIHLYGHIHFNNINFIKNRYHVGVDTNNFTPVCIDSFSFSILEDL